MSRPWLSDPLQRRTVLGGLASAAFLSSGTGCVADLDNKQRRSGQVLEEIKETYGDEPYVNTIGRGVRETNGDREWVVIVTVDEGALEKARTSIPAAKNSVRIIIQEGEERTLE